MRGFLRALTVTAVVGLGALVGPSSPACACSCAGPVSPEQAAEQVDAVFVGVVRKIDRPWRLFGSSADPVWVTVDVSEVHKGDLPATVRVATASESASCGYEFVEGRRYLIFARGGADELSTGLCDGNRDLAYESDPFSPGRPPRPVDSRSDSPGPWLIPTVMGLAGIGLLGLRWAVWWSRFRADSSRTA